MLVPYDTSWPEAYRSESFRLREAVGSDIVRISHIGSTAVLGLTAKPTIDILLEIEPDTYLPPGPARTYGNLRLSLHAAAAKSAAGNDVHERLYPPRLRKADLPPARPIPRRLG
ncbi:MAG: GrpB family protein [Alistipes inops]